MTYILIQKGEIAKYPASFRDLQRLHPDTSFPRIPKSAADEHWPKVWAKLNEFGLFVVRLTSRPAPSDAITRNVVEGTPELVDGVWTQVWEEVDAPAEQIAARQESAALEQEHEAVRDAVKVDDRLKSFLAMTPAQAREYTSSADNAELRRIVADLAFAMRVLIRREFS